MCDACHADEHYTEPGRAWVGGLGAGLTAPFFANIHGSNCIGSLCEKHRGSLCRYLEEIGAALNVKLLIEERAEGFFITCDGVDVAAEPVAGR